MSPGRLADDGGIRSCLGADSNRRQYQAESLAGWNKVFILHLQMMLRGYQTALALGRGC